MAEDKPTAAFVLSLIGGIFILLNGLVLAALAEMLAFLLPFLEEELTVLTVIALVFGVIVLIGAIMLYAKPEQHVVWGIVVLLFSLFSVVIGGGFFIGLILGLIGGILGIVWKPPVAPAPAMAPTPPPMGR